MKIIRTTTKLCLSCMTEHDVSTVEICERVPYGRYVLEYPAVYDYCDKSNSFFADENMMNKNARAFSEARKTVMREDETYDQNNDSEE